MLYIVEMALNPGHTDEDWERWAIEMKPAELLMTVPGIRSCQRFKGVSDPLAYYAHYDIDGAEVLTSPAYRGVGGGVRVKNWNSHNIAYWHRNIVEGVASVPAVPEGYLLLVKNASSLDFPDEGMPFIRLTTVGLDKTAQYRGIAVVPAGEAKLRISRDSDIRVYKPIAPQMRKDPAGQTTN